MNGFTIFKLLVIIVALVIFAAATVNFISESYAEYQEYYQAIMADKEYQKYLETLPVTFEGLSVSVNDGVTYFATGKARPKKEDLTVIAHFSEKGKIFDRILDYSEYELVVPADFSTNGGSVTVKYLYQPEKAEGATEDPAPIVRTTDINIVLTPVVLTNIKVVTTPYRVYYSDAMSFDLAGIKLEANFNCGEKVILDASDVVAMSEGTLAVGTESVKVSYTHADVTVETDVAITVTTAANYNDGEILEIKAEGKPLVIDGQSLANAKPIVRATYKSGNRLILSSDEYSVSGNAAQASFFNACILDVTLKNNASIKCSVPATVRFVAEAEDATANGGTKSTVTDKNGSFITVLEKLTNGNTVSFVINSDTIAKGKFTLRVATDAKNSIQLTDVLVIKVNGRHILVPTSVSLEAYNDGYCFVECNLPEIVLNSGSNTVELIFDGMDGYTVAVDSLGVETSYNGIISSDIEDHIVNSFEAGMTNPELTVELAKAFHSVTNGLYIHGMCTDGQYIYVTRTTDAEEDNKIRCIMVSKYDATTFELIASAPLSADASCESNAGITYYDGKIIIYYNNGTEWWIDPSLTGEWAEYTGFAFEGTEGVALRDVYYNAVTDKFAVLSGETITIYGKDMKAINSFNVKTQTSGLYITRMTGTTDYLYVGFTKDTVVNPTVQMYDWSGNYIGKFVAPNTDNPSGTTKSNIQGFVFLGGDIIFTQIRWSTKGSGFLKVSYPKVDAVLDYKLSVGEYVAAAQDKGVTAQATASPSNKISATGIYAMGGAYDGEYLYISMCGTKNLTATISKIDPVTLKVVGETVTFVPAEIDGDNSRIFLKDGKLYCIIRDGSMYEINTADFNGTGCNVTESTLSFAEYGTAFSASWNDSVGKYVVLTNNNKIHIVNEDLTADKRDIAVKSGSLTATSVSTDDKFIYVNYKNGNDKTINSVDVYTWGGDKVGSFDISGFTLGTDINFNVQALFFVGDEMHATVCSWTSGHMVFYDWIVTINEDNLK